MVGRKVTILHNKLWSNVDVAGPDDCWLWTASTGSRGYGQIRFMGKRLKAHRVSFALHHGRDPEGFVLHTCDNRRCVNPAHLYEGTHCDNMRDMVTRSRAARGVSHGRAKLTEEDVREIRRLREQGVFMRVIAAQFEISTAMVSNITTRKAWRHVT